MKRITMLLPAALALALLLDAAEPVSYVFEQVTRRVTLVAADGSEMPAAVGASAYGGNRVRTGWLSHTILGAPRYGARFEIFAGSDVMLASDAPGVLLTLERGRLKAIFDKITGDEPRIVKTPGALLAVRGTRYGVEVDGRGNAWLAVFDGMVEVQSPLAPEPLFVRAREVCQYGRAMRPETRLAPHGMNEQRWQRQGAGAGADDRSGRPEGRDGFGTREGTGSQDRGREGTPRPPGGSGRGHGDL